MSSSNSSSSIRIEKRQVGEVDVFIFHLEGTPNEARDHFKNQLNAKFIKDFSDALDEALRQSKKGRNCAIVTTSTGKHYSDGLDLSYVLSIESVDEKIAFLKSVETLLYKLLTFPMITVAAVNGHAFAGGMLLALAHDYRISNEEKGFWCMSEIDIPSPLTPGYSALINSKLNAQTVAHMMITGARLNAKEMQANQVVWQTAKGEAAVLEEAVKLAAKYGVKSKSVMREIKEDVWWNAAKQLKYGSAARAKL